jgi:hypothetical protein
MEVGGDGLGGLKGGGSGVGKIRQSFKYFGETEQLVHDSVGMSVHEIKSDVKLCTSNLLQSIFIMSNEQRRCQRKTFTKRLDQPGIQRCPQHGTDNTS